MKTQQPNEGLRLYLAKYWRNDGGWHSGGSYDCQPRYVFKAKDDTEALALADAFVRLLRVRNEEFSLTSLSHIILGKIKLRELSRGTKATSLEAISLEDLHQKMKEADFDHLENFIDEQLKLDY